jgi:hypothetical protein
VSGKNPTPSEVAYGKGMATAAHQYAEETSDRYERLIDDSDPLDWNYDAQRDEAYYARNDAEQAHEYYDRASNWAWLAEHHPELLKDEPEHDREAGS